MGDNKKKIHLTGIRGEGKYAVVDKGDYEFLKDYGWFNSEGYAITNVKIAGENKKVPMHRMIMCPVKGYVVDHIDRDPLNNTRSNLRVCTQRQNTLNRRSNIVGTSKYKGVCRIKGSERWGASIKIGFFQKHIGRYSSEEEAAKAYDYMAEKEYREYAFLNFPDETPTKPKERELSSQYKGVAYSKRDRVFRPQVSYLGKRYSFGSFKCENDGARAFNSGMEALDKEGVMDNKLTIKECRCCNG